MLVSVVCPTSNRLSFMPGFVHCFLSQTFHDSELVILDDGSAPCYSVIPDHARIRYEYGQPGTWKTLGEKRNALNAHAHGDILINFDSDDWYASDYLANQVDLLISSSKQMVGFHDLLYYCVRNGGTFRYKYRGTGNYAPGATQVYWRDYWEKNPYSAALHVGEDAAFSTMAEKNGVLKSVDSCGRIVVRSHGGNTGQHALGSHDFPRVDIAEFPKEFFAANQQ